MNELQKPYVSVIDPITTALQRVKLILFNPFEIGKWFIIGFCAWLANGTGVFTNLCEVIADLCKLFANSGEFVRHHLQVIIIAAAIAMFVVLTIGVVCLWLSSRSRFMFLHCVAENKAEVKVPWHKYRRQGNSLFLFRVAMMFIGLFCFGLLIGGGIVLGIAFGRGGSPGPVILIVAVGILLLIPLAMIFGVIGKFLNDFVVPIMYLGECTCMAGWSKFGSILSVNKWRFTLYVLFQIVVGMVIVTIALSIACIACCPLACLVLLAMIPVVGVPFALVLQYIFAVILLPLGVFERSYSLYYPGQYGPEFDVFGRSQDEAAPDEFGPAVV